MQMVNHEHKIDRIIHRHERILQRIFQKEEIEPSKHKYILMEISIDQMKANIETFKRNFSKISDLVTVRPYDPNDKEDHRIFSDIFNLVLLSSPDPWRPISREEAEKHFRTPGTFLAFLYGNCVGYGVLTIENSPENSEDGKIGVIAGIGVHPKHRRKKIALRLALEMGKWFLDRPDIIKLQCEVYEKNDVSIKFITSFGFKKVSEFFLD